MKFSRDIKSYPLALLGLLCFSSQADELDTLQFYASENVQRDSNPFRLSDSPNAPQIGSRSDTIAVTTLGFKLNKPVGLQRFEFDANVEDHRYKRFTDLDFTGVNYAAAWRWSFTPALHGNLTSDRREYVDNTSDVQINGSGVGQASLNRRAVRSTLFDAEYEVDGAWRLLGGVFDRVSTSSQPTFEGDSKVRGLEVGARRVFSSGTSLAYRFRNGSGDYSDLRSAVPVGEFKDREHEVRLDWAPSGKTTVQARLAHFDRAHDGLAARDFSGVVGQADVNWAVTGKTSVLWGAARELGSYQTTDSSYYQGYRFFVAPTWRATEKIAVRLRYDHGVRDFRGAAPGFAAIDRQDTTRLASLALEWQAARALKLVASMQRDKRTSNDSRFDYVSNSVGVLAQLSF